MDEKRMILVTDGRGFSCYYILRTKIMKMERTGKFRLVHLFVHFVHFATEGEWPDEMGDFWTDVQKKKEP